MDLYVNKEDICIILNTMCDDIFFKPDTRGFLFKETNRHFDVDNKVPLNLLKPIIESAMQEFVDYLLSQYTGFREEN